MQIARSTDWSAIPFSYSALSTSNARLAPEGEFLRRARANSIMPGETSIPIPRATSGPRARRWWPLPQPRSSTTSEARGRARLRTSASRYWSSRCGWPCCSGDPVEAHRSKKDLMSVVLYEGVVATPRNLDQGARRCVPGDCPRAVFSRSAVAEQRADFDTRSAPYRVGLEPAARDNSNAVAKDHFTALQPVNRAMPTTIDDRISRATRRPRDHVADRVLPSVAECANAFITHDGLRKRLWRHPNNPIAPRRFPSWCKSTPRRLCFLHSFR
jgi:hypothetical protein